MNEVLSAFGLQASDFAIDRVGTGHIHQTFKLTGKNSYILQRVNKNVFKQPEIIAANLRHASHYLSVNFPDYPFLRCIPAKGGDELTYDMEGFPWRLFPYQENTITVDKAETTDEAFKAAGGFSLLTRNLDGIDVGLFRETIPRFHDLSWRFRQFEEALARTSRERRETAVMAIGQALNFSSLTRKYESLIEQNVLQLRVMHNDTKINNILVDSKSAEVVCVIDLDTLMPGYFIYDLGDMVRTFVSPVDEEERDYSKIIVRKEMYDALLSGYLTNMGSVLSGGEKDSIPFSGKMMTYIMALRFLTDYLNVDTYYHTTYPGQNLVRAGNQLRLLELLEKNL